MTREEKIDYIIWSVHSVFDVHLDTWYFDCWTDLKLDREIEWFKYFWNN